jgi:glyoxylase-like metal-dependent hydrolase (beta-lactamase superfamily II)/rhodanese-related sulfurtransferase
MVVGSIDKLADSAAGGSRVPQITAAELYARISQPNDIFLLDVRNDEEFTNWRIESRYTPTTLHLFYGNFLEDEEGSVQKVPRDRKIVVVCAKGGASDYVAEILRTNYSLDAANLDGGMIAWGNYYATHPVVSTDAYQIFQFDRVARGCLSYVLVSQGQAAVIDPVRHINQYVQLLAEEDASLVLVLDTHAHADHISGGPALAAGSGAPYHLHPYDGIHPFDMLPAKLEYRMLSNGQTFHLGDLTLQVIHAPGHTLGQVNFLATGSDGAAYLFSGDNLFIHSFGRPDLGGQGEAWAPIVYSTIFERIPEVVPSKALVLPGHYAQHTEAGESGSFAEQLSDLWEENPDLGIREREAFIQHVLAHLPEMPPQYVDIKRVNAGLLQPDEEEASELELGKNVCALSTAY